MFTANSMNCLCEAIGMALPGNGTILATHARRWELFERAGVAYTVVLPFDEELRQDALPVDRLQQDGLLQIELPGIGSTAPDAGSYTNPSL